jgi:hypothetical protein
MHIFPLKNVFLRCLIVRGWKKDSKHPTVTKRQGNKDMTYRITAAAFVLALVATQVAANQIWTITELSVSVVYIHRSETARILDEGVMKELWLKGPADSSPQPHLITHSGTAFLVADSTYLYLVTAAHVAKEMGPTSKATLAGANDTPQTLPIGDLCGTPSPRWVQHSSADVAVIVLTPSQQTIQQYLQKRFLPLEVFRSADAAPARETQLTVIGFPKGLGVKDRFSPLTLQTLPASGFLTLKRFDTGIETEFFLLQNPATAGYSGAPVVDVSRYVMGAVTTTGGGTRVYGLIHGNIKDDAGGNLAAVVPARFIVETLRLATKR